MAKFGFNMGFIYPKAVVDSTVLLLHFNGTNGSTTFTDSSPKGYTLTANGSAALDTAQSKFGSASLKCTGASGDYAQVSGNNADFGFGSGDFTIEGFCRRNGTAGNQVLYDQRPAASSGAYPLIFLTGTTLTYFVGGSTQISGGTISADSAWHHWAVARQGTSTKMYLDGNQVGSTYSDSNSYLAVNNRPRIGESADLGSDWNGWIDELRVLKGLAAYTGSTYTVPTAEFPA